MLNHEEQKKIEREIFRNLYCLIYDKITTVFPYQEFCIHKDSDGSLYTEQELFYLIIKRCIGNTNIGPYKREFEITPSVITALMPIIKSTCAFQEAEIKYSLGSRSSKSGEIDINKRLRFKILQSIDNTISAQGNDSTKNAIQVGFMSYFLDKDALKDSHKNYDVDVLQSASNEVFNLRENQGERI
jgi:hypothetical protein